MNRVHMKYVYYDDEKDAVRLEIIWIPDVRRESNLMLRNSAVVMIDPITSPTRK